MPSFITDQEMMEMYGDTPEDRGEKCAGGCGGGGCDYCSGD